MFKIKKGNKKTALSFAVLSRRSFNEGGYKLRVGGNVC
jgi:hypothetical protein